MMGQRSCKSRSSVASRRISIPSLPPTITYSAAACLLSRWLPRSMTANDRPVLLCTRPRTRLVVCVLQPVFRTRPYIIPRGVGELVHSVVDQLPRRRSRWVAFSTIQQREAALELVDSQDCGRTAGYSHPISSVDKRLRESNNDVIASTRILSIPAEISE